MDEILQQLTEVSIRQQQITEHRVRPSRSVVRTAPARLVPLPDPRVQVTQLLPKLTAHDDVEDFLQIFENTAIREGWEREDWARLLVPLLTGETQRAYFAMPSLVSDKYIELKKEILTRLGLYPVCAAQYFHDWEYKSRLPARTRAAELSRLAQYWLLDGEPTAAQVAEHVVIDRLLRALPRTHRQAFGIRNPATLPNSSRPWSWQMLPNTGMLGSGSV